MELQRLVVKKECTSVGELIHLILTDYSNFFLFLSIKLHDCTLDSKQKLEVLYRDSLSPKEFFYFNKIQLSGLHAHKYPYRKMIPNTICWRIVMSRKKRKKSLSKNFVMIGQLISISFCVSKSSLFDSVVCSLTSTTFVSFVFLFQKHCIFRIPANCPAHPVYILTRKVGIGSSSEAWW